MHEKPAIAANAGRTIRIFISSTFRDFTDERDLLVRKVFPELRQRCRERQVELVDVDLRWGITEEEAEQGRVLPICLSEIDRARPFFIGLLGERYGWVPTTDTFDTSLLIEQPWLAEHAGGTSVTELEILHGVLNNPRMAGRAAFYFRDPAWAAKRGADFASEGVAEQQKLTDLKRRIRESGFPVIEDYVDPETLAQQVRDDLWACIDEAYPQGSIPDAPSLERRRHDAYAASRRRFYLGGGRYFQALDAALAGDSPQPVLVRGPSGCGKTALLANWLEHHANQRPETVVVIAHHLTCGADAANPVSLAVRIMQEIGRLVGQDFAAKGDPDEQLRDLPAWLATASAWAEQNGKHVLIALDGLDKLCDRQHLRWFPSNLPPNVRIVASCLDGDILDAALRRLDWHQLVVAPLSKVEQSEFIQTYLLRFRKQLTAEQVRYLQAHPLAANPLFLLTVLEELRVFGAHEQLSQRLATLLSPPPSKPPGDAPTVDDAFEHVLARIESDHGRESVQSVLEAIWASRGGLYTDEILAIAAVPPATWAGISNGLDESFYETNGRIDFSHDYLRKAVEDRYAISDTATTLHRRLGEYFATLPADDRVAEELPWQWREADEHDLLRAYLTDLDSFSRLFLRDPFELLNYWLWLGDDFSKAYETSYRETLQQSNNAFSGLFHIAHRLAAFLVTAGCYNGFAVELRQSMLKDSEVRNGPRHPETLAVTNDLGLLYREQGSNADAEQLLRQALTGHEDVFGPDHPDTVACINNLAIVLSDMNKNTEAETLYRRALETRERVLGPNHRDTLSTLHNLSLLLSDLGNLSDAERLSRQASDGYEHSLGPDNPTTTNCVSDLAAVLHARHAYTEAGDLHRRALESLETSRGPDHPNTLSAALGLANHLSDRGDYVSAEPLYRRVLNGRERLLGDDHPDTIASVNTLAICLKDMGQYDDAAPLYDRALEARSTLLGPTHPDTLASISNYANLRIQQGELEEAEALLRQTLAARIENLGHDHPATLDSRYNLGLFLGQMKRYEEATDLLHLVLVQAERTLGSAHPTTLRSADTLATVFVELRAFKAAEEIFRHTTAVRLEAFGADHPDTIESLNRLTAFLSGLELLDHHTREPDGQPFPPPPIARTSSDHA